MLIDWFTVIAQLFNFLLLVWLLKRFLYKPIMNAVDHREKSIEEELENAQNQMKKAEVLNQDYIAQMENLKQKRETLMSEAIQDANNTKQKLLEETKKDLARMNEKQKEVLKDPPPPPPQEESYQNDLVRKAQTEIFQIAKKALHDLASEDIEKHMYTIFVDRLKSLTEEEKEKLSYTLSDSHYKIIFKSSYELDTVQKTTLTQLMTDIALHHVTMIYVEQTDLINGFELMTGDFKLSWNFEEYLISMYKKSLPSHKSAVHVKPEDNS